MSFCSECSIFCSLIWSCFFFGSHRRNCIIICQCQITPELCCLFSFDTLRKMKKIQTFNFTHFFEFFQPLITVHFFPTPKFSFTKRLHTRMNRVYARSRMDDWGNLIDHHPRMCIARFVVSLAAGGGVSLFTLLPRLLLPKKKLPIGAVFFRYFFAPWLFGGHKIGLPFVLRRAFWPESWLDF